MTSPSTDPQPEQTPGLEPGGGVPPGETPPGESSTSGVSREQPGLPSGRANKAAYVLILAVVVVVVLMFLGYAIGLLG